MRTSRLAWLLLGCIAALLALCLSACHTTRPNPDERQNAGIVPSAAGLNVDSSRRNMDSSARNMESLPARLTDAIGLSTPAGRARRQARRDAAATVPRKVKVKDGAFAWGDYAKATNAGKKAQQATDSAAVVVTGGGAAAVGTGASATGGATTTKPGFWQSPAGYAAAAVLAGIGVYGLYLAWPVLLAVLPKRRKEPLV